MKFKVGDLPVDDSPGQGQSPLSFSFGSEINQPPPSPYKDILILGEGNFSYTRGIVEKNRPGIPPGTLANNIYATEYQAYQAVFDQCDKLEEELEPIEKVQAYRNEYKDNVEYLKKSGVKVLFEVDATIMATHPELKMKKFNEIQFNNPFVSSDVKFEGQDPPLEQTSTSSLLSGFFGQADQLLAKQGKIVVGLPVYSEKEKFDEDPSKPGQYSIYHHQSWLYNISVHAKDAKYALTATRPLDEIGRAHV